MFQYSKAFFIFHVLEEFCWFHSDQYSAEPCILFHSNAAAPIQFLHCHRLADLACT